ncbi:MAG: sensor domain-containing diguanylate cyclase [Fervidobacterium sp.]|uniref:sensor domain-containing diguanylate cyclase n=1 Tax=Fervidobacterium sp. TaxID=1871331 RepID=UPI004049896A
MSKKELFFVISLFLIGGLFFFLSRPIIISYDLRLSVLGFLIMVLAKFVEIPIAGVIFNMKAFASLFLLLFLPPETVALLAIGSLFVEKKLALKTLLLRSSFEIAQFGIATFFFKNSPTDYLSIPLFAVSYFLINSFLTIFYVTSFAKVSGKKFFRVTAIVFLLGVYSSALLTTVYLFPEAKLTNLLFGFLLYSGFLIQLYYTVNSQVWYQELQFEKEQIQRETENLLKMPKVLESLETEDVDTVLSRMLEIACKMTGFSVALMSLFDNRSGKVVRISKYGITDEDFEVMKQKQPDIKDTIVLMQSRFDIGGVFFIPKGTLALDEEYTFKPLDYAKLDAENAWDPDDLFLVPIVYNNRIIGYISFDKPSNGLRPTKREVELAKFFAWQILQILKNSKYSTLFTSPYGKEVSVSDLMEEMSRAIATNRSFTLVHLDIDNFERINLEKGFRVGDEIIRIVKYNLEQEVKSYGVYSHLGDEFMVLLWTKSKSDGMLVAERVVESVKERYPGITFTGAIVKYPADAPDLNGVLSKVRTALIAGKKSGGGRIVNI